MVKHARPANVSPRHACFSGRGGSDRCAEYRKWPTVVAALVLGMPYCRARTDEIPGSSIICINCSQGNHQRRNGRLLPSFAARCHAKPAAEPERRRGYRYVYPRNAKIAFCCRRAMSKLADVLRGSGNYRSGVSPPIRFTLVFNGRRLATPEPPQRPLVVPS